MSTSTHKHRTLGAVALAGIAAAIVTALVGGATPGGAARAAVPENTSAPTVTGTPQEGQILTGSRGTWSNSPTDYNYFWSRCNNGGNSCADISGANAATYTLTSADVGNTVRFKVQARNSSGATFASSVPTAVVTAQAPATTTTPAATGCPKGSGPVSVKDVSQPARLLLDGQQADPSPMTRRASQLIVRYHVSDTCGHSVQGALVYVTAVPFGQFDVPSEQTTGNDGWAEVVLHPQPGLFPVSSRQQVIALFVRARKTGEDLLAGISTRRLFSVRLAG